jgi:hypothetical protein
LLPRMSSAPSPPACHRSRGRQGQALRVAAKSAAILDRHSTRWRSRTAVGAEEWLRRGQTKEWARKQVSCQDFVITIREGRHQFSWHKKQEQSRISPSDTVMVLTTSMESSETPKTPPSIHWYHERAMHPIISGPPGPNLAFSGNRESLYFFNRPSTTFNLGEVTPKPWKAQDHFFQRRQLR